MNAHPPPSRGVPSSGRAAVFFLTVWLVAAALLAIPVVLLVRDATGTAGAPSAAGDRATPSASSPSGASPATPSGAPTPVTTRPTAAPPPSTPATPSSLRMTVVDTCGADGTGDCFLTLRAGATGSSTDLGRMTEGTTFTGQSVRASASGVRTGRWVRLPEGAYVSGAYVSRLEDLPAC